MINKKVNVSFIWGWTWSLNVLTGLRENENLNLAALISMADSWGSAWILRDEFWILPPWDVRRAVLALSEESFLMRRLFEYRFSKWWTASWHTIWNLLITAMTDIMWDFEKGLDWVAKMFRVKGKIIPITTDLSNLCVKLENWEIIKWETNVDVPTHDPNLRIEEAYLEPASMANPKAISTIENSDIIIIWPWDTYTSIVPNLLTEWIKDALKNSQAKKVFFTNIMTKNWETNWFWVEDFVDVIEKYIWTWVIDYVVVNNWYISEDLIQKYKDQEWKRPVKLRDKDFAKGKHYKVIERDLLHESDFVRHSSEKLASVINEIIEWWIK